MPIIYKSHKTNKVLWAITKDILDPTSDRNITDQELLKEIKKDAPNHFKLYDDDGKHYYSGYSYDADSERAFEPLDWAMADSGCTEIKYRNPKTGKYETL